VLLRHESGAVSTLAVSLDAPPEAMAYELLFLGPTGPVQVPTGDATPVGAFAAAIDQLIAGIAAGHRTHPCDVRFGREVVAVLAEAEAVRL
jgi:hypothetical protein